jgi:alpha-tubulin suppressor-like RCC1 family protein
MVVGTDGNVYGAGNNSYGQLGNSPTPPAIRVTTPVKMSLPAGVLAQEVRTGHGTTVVLTTNNKLYTVGSNNDGQLGDGTTTNSSTPKANAYVNILPATYY